MPDHLTDANLHRFHAGEMPADENAQLLEHLGRCADCSTRNAELLKSHHELLGQARGMPPTTAVAGPLEPTSSGRADAYNRLRVLFAQAIKLNPAARRAFIDAQCTDDAELRRELSALLDVADDTMAADEPLADHRIEQQRARLDEAIDAPAPPTMTQIGPSPRGVGGAPERIGPFKILATIGEGGMGTVYEAEQDSPKRTVALKIIRAGLASPALIKRFALESQVLGRLQHPGIAQVHQAGTADTPSGPMPYFAMEYVRGVDVRQYVNDKKLSKRDRLELLARLCDAVEHAHQKGVIHRDLKPGNILVDASGQPKILDFGVARATDSDMQVTTMQTDVGQIIGTLQYMSPEQVAADPGELDTRSDVYALGVIAYELLTGQPPYDLKNRMIHEAARIIREEEPTSASSINRVFRGDIETIVAKALEKDKVRRYQSAAGLAEDIRRYLEDEPILARPPSAMYQLQKFAKRNRTLVTGVAAVFVVLVAGVIVSTRSAMRERAAKEEVLRLADLKRLADARAAADDLWPAHPENIEAMKTWLSEKAVPLRDNLPKHQSTLAALRDQALAYDLEQQRHDRETHPLAGELSEKQQQLPKLHEQLEEARAEENEDAAKQAKKITDLEKSITETTERIDGLGSTVQERRTWKFSDDAQQWQHDTLAGLVVDLEAFVDEGKKGTLAGVEERLDFARTIEEQSITGAEVADAWTEAITDITALDVYDGLRLQPQLGLVPLRRDPRSGLWEFWHVQTGARPEHNSDPEAVNPWILTGDTGLVFVLIPGGTFQMGAQKDDPEGFNYDPGAEDGESPVHEIVLDPFFVSKYEMTQGQWLRFTGANPSNYGSDWKWDDKLRPDGTIHENTAWNPVDHVSWIDCTEILGRLALVLPTEAQWEYAARAGTTTIWWTGDGKASIGTKRAGNLADAWSRSVGGPDTWRYEDWDDYWGAHSPAGSFAPNPFGLHDTIGNMAEWTMDLAGSYADDKVEPGTGLRLVFAERYGDRYRAIRDSTFQSVAANARSSRRNRGAPQNQDTDLGVRPARVLRSSQ
jgi:serine/threonine protein kinase/formylglycine-generating enzyme required for sulfatase activity